MQKTVSEWIKPILNPLIFEAQCLVWAMWGLFNVGRTILIEFPGSAAVHPGGRARRLPEGRMAGAASDCVWQRAHQGFKFFFCP